mmetsp:Transcript_9086/g.15539  ORF Transcript_9086/g.15539 Transcript_9086/m.15539 type:complete len:449 (-) Transcript_9086:2269-3615(-)
MRRVVNPFLSYLFAFVQFIEISTGESVHTHAVGAELVGIALPTRPTMRAAAKARHHIDHCRHLSHHAGPAQGTDLLRDRVHGGALVLVLEQCVHCGVDVLRIFCFFFEFVHIVAFELHGAVGAPAAGILPLVFFVLFRGVRDRRHHRRLGLGLVQRVHSGRRQGRLDVHTATVGVLDEARLVHMSRRVLTATHARPAEATPCGGAIHRLWQHGLAVTIQGGLQFAFVQRWLAETLVVEVIVRGLVAALLGGLHFLVQLHRTFHRQSHGRTADALLAMVPEQQNQHGQRQQQIERCCGEGHANGEVAQQRAHSCQKHHHRAAKYCVPHLSTSLVGIDVHIQQLIFVHQVRHREVERTQRQNKRSNRGVGHHDHEHHHYAGIAPAVHHRRIGEGTRAQLASCTAALVHAQTHTQNVQQRKDTQHFNRHGGHCLDNHQTSKIRAKRRHGGA